MDFRQPEIKIEYQEELNLLLERVRQELGEDAAELFVFFVSGFSSSGGRAHSAAQRILNLSLEKEVQLKFAQDKKRFYFITKSGDMEYLDSFGEKRSSLIPFILESVLIAHRALVEMPRGDYFEHAIRVVQEAYSNLLEL